MRMIFKKSVSFASLGSFFVALFMPIFAFADGLIPKQLVPCDGSAASPCDFPALIHGVQHVITFLLVVAAPIASILFAYAGFLYLTAQGDTGQVSKAHSIFLTVFLGLVFALAAWLVVNTISNALLGSSDYSLLEGVR